MTTVQAKRELAKAEGVAKTIRESGGSAVAVAGDMLDDNYIKELVKKAAEFGGGKIHIIVNNAGFTWDGVVHKVRLSALLTPTPTDPSQDHRQTMGHHRRHPRHSPLQAHPHRRPLLPRQGWRTPQHYQH